MATRAKPGRQRRDRDNRRQPLPTDERERQATADDDTQSERGVQDPGTRLADVEDLQREQDEQDVEGADDDHPQRQDGNDDPGASVAGDQSQPVEEAAPIRRRRVVPARRRSATGIPAEGSRTTSAAAMRDAIVAAPNTVVGVATARMAAATNGPTSMPAPSIVPDRPFAAVSSSGVRDRLGMSEPCAGRVTDSAVAAHVAARTTTRGAAPMRHPDPRRAVGRHLRQVAQEQEPVTRDAVPEPSDEWRQHGARHQLDDRHQPDTRRADGFVGVQQDRDPRPEFDRVEEEEGELRRAEGTGCAGSPGPP